MAGRYDEGAAVIDTLLAAEPGNSDALEASRDIRRWSRDRSQQMTPPTDIRAGWLFDTYREPYPRSGRLHPWCGTPLLMGAGRGIGKLRAYQPANR